MKVVSFINEKGGTCKTTFTVNFASFFALKKKKILILDLDSQSHAGKSLGVPVAELDRTILDLLLHPEMDPKDAIVETRIEGLHIVCSQKNLSEFSQRAANKKDKELRLLQVVQRIGKLGYDYVFIDSPPSAGLVTTNILVASTDVVVPVALTYLALDGCAEVVRSIRGIRETFPEARPKLGMVIPALYRQTRLANEIVAKLAEHFPTEISKTIAGFNVRIDEAQSFGQTIWEYDPDGKGALILRALASELYNKILK